MNSTKTLVYLGTLLFAGPAFGQAATSEEAAAAEPAAAEPAAAATPAAPAKQPRTTVTTAGLATQDITMGGAGNTAVSSGEDWGFKFKGFMRGPMRLSMSKLDTAPNGASKYQFHAPPVTPDSNYTTWNYTNNNPGPWAELIFQYGNSRAMMTSAIASYNISSGGWRELQDQLGIDRAFVTLKFPEALGDLGGMNWDVGVFSNRYGAMGKYDAGAYETYIMGRTRAAGATGTFDLEVADDFKLILEVGAGAKMDQQHWSNKASASTEPGPLGDKDYNKERGVASWEPYAGKVQMGTSLLFHAHAGAVLAGGMLTATGHLIQSWTQDQRATGKLGAAANADGVRERPDALMRVLGLDLRLDGGWLGDGYLGVSTIKAQNVYALSDTIEVLHSQGGWQFGDNFTDYQGHNGGGNGPNYVAGTTWGNGTVTSVGFQYSGSLAAYMTQKPFWGDGADVSFKVFSIYTKIGGLDSRSVDNVKEYLGTSKLKWGFDVNYSPMPVMAMALRYDNVNPDMNNGARSFMVFSPRLVFRTEFVTHEQVIIQYQYYKNNSGVLLPHPFNGNYDPAPWGNSKPDKHAITIAASMWW
jgi:hypothetical protein